MPDIINKPELPDQPESTRVALSRLKDKIEKEIISEQEQIEQARIQFKSLLQGQFEKEMREEKLTHIDLDHYLLALGQDVDFKLFNTSDGVLAFGMFQQAHQGSISYGLLRTAVAPDMILNVGTGKKMSVRNVILYPLQRIRNNDFFGLDYEWIALVSISFALRNHGQIPLLQTYKGTEISLKQLLELNQKEFDFTYHKERLSPEDFKKIEGHNEQMGTCFSLHAFHALVDYAILKKDTEKLRQYIDFAFQKLSNLDREVDGLLQANPAPHYFSEAKKEQYALKMRLRFVSHLLTPLTDILEYRLDLLSQKQRSQMRKVILAMVQDAKRFWELSKLPGHLDVSEETFAVSTLSHVLDILNHSKNI